MQDQALSAYQRAWTLDPTHYKVPVPISAWVWQAAYLAALESIDPGLEARLREARIEWAEFPSEDLLQSEAPPINPFSEVIFRGGPVDAAEGPMEVHLFRGNLGRPFADNRRLGERIAEALQAEARSLGLIAPATEE